MTEEELHQRLYPEAHSKLEYIICAAIHYDNGREYQHQPSNITNGFVICGWRHHSCYAISFQIGSDSIGKYQCTQGFLTSKNRFVDRKEGGEIAYLTGQITKITDCLFSEDLY